MERDVLREQYDAAREIEREARKLLYSKDGKLVPVIKRSDGMPTPNPALSEWHRAVQLVRSLARELGVADESDSGPLAVATGESDVLGALDALSMILAEAIDRNRGHGLAALSREYRDTVMAADEIRKSKPEDDAIGLLVAEGAARAHRLGLSVVK